MSGFADFGIFLGSALGVGSFGGGILATLLFTLCFCLLPCLVFTKGKSLLAEMISGFLGLCFSVTVGWFDIWVFSVITLITAVFFAVKVKDMI